jgi:hypothetical protein
MNPKNTNSTQDASEPIVVPLFRSEIAQIQEITERKCEVYARPEAGSGGKRQILGTLNGGGQWMKAKILSVNVVIEFEDGTWGLIHPSKISTYGASQAPISCFIPERPVT